MKSLTIDVEKPYQVHIGLDILPRLPDLIRETTGRPPGSAFVVTDRTVARLYLKGIEKSLQNSGFVVSAAVLKPGEGLKSHKHLYRLLRMMVHTGLSRDSVVIGLGGGVIGDLAGFAASIYMRGCAFIQIPTTLLAQVDSSVGGKVGINLPEGKNLVGSFFHPLLVLEDIGTLETLPEREFLCGLAEILKYGLIKNSELFQRIRSRFLQDRDFGMSIPNQEVKRLLFSDSDFLLGIITESVGMKGQIVTADEREHSLRMILNFGHTFGHAVEALSRYKRFLHGEAVMLGMKIAILLSAETGRLERDEKSRALGLLNLFELPGVEGIRAEEVCARISRDKKKKEGKVHYVLLEKIGKAVIETEVKEEEVLRCIREVLEG
jgi:3-dehydroquinate synthase